MVFYTGAWAITRKAWNFRNTILADFLYTDGLSAGRQKKAHLHKWSSDNFNRDGLMTKRCTLLRYYRDLRLFDRDQWCMLTEDETSPEAKLGLVEGSSVKAWVSAADVTAERNDDVRLGSLLCDFFEEAEEKNAEQALPAGA